MFDAFVKLNGAASSDGILAELFDDLDSQEANEQHRMFPPDREHYDARAALIELYGYKPEVTSRDKPCDKYWEEAERARFIEALVHAKSAKIAAAVHAILKVAGDDDYLALACMRCLVGKGLDSELADLCRQRIGKGGSSEKDFRAS